MSTLKLLAAGLVASLLAIPSSPARADHFRDLRDVVDRYEASVDRFERELSRSRRASDYAERIAEQLEDAAEELEDAVRFRRDPRALAIAYDHVYLLHTRMESLLVDRSGLPDGQLVYLWAPVSAAFEPLVCAMEGCDVVYPLVTQRRPVVHPIASPGIVVTRPAPIGVPLGYPYTTSRPSVCAPTPSRQTVSRITIGPSFGIQFGVRSTNPFDRDHDHDHDRHRHGNSFGQDPRNMPGFGMGHHNSLGGSHDDHRGNGFRGNVATRPNDDPFRRSQSGGISRGSNRHGR